MSPSLEASGLGTIPTRLISVPASQKAPGQGEKCGNWQQAPKGTLDTITLSHYYIPDRIIIFFFFHSHFRRISRLEISTQ